MSKGISNDLIDDYMQENEDEMENYEIESARKILIKKQQQACGKKLADLTSSATLLFPISPFPFKLMPQKVKENCCIFRDSTEK